jgi:hypothetical protein
MTFSRQGALAVVLLHVTSVGAEGAESSGRAQALVLGASLNRFVARQLPVVVDLPGDRTAGVAPSKLTVVEARYCGGVDGGRGRALALVSSDGTAARSPLFTSDRDCDEKLAVLARRHAPAGTGSTARDGGAVGDTVVEAVVEAVVEIMATWTPWSLQLELGDVAPVGDGSAALGRALARARASGPLATFETAALRVTTARGSSLSMDLAVDFPKAKESGDAVALTVTPAAPQGQGRERVRGAPPPSAAGAPTGTDGIVSATLPFINRVVAFLGQDGPMLLTFDREIVEIREVQVAGAEGSIVVRGRATLRSTGDSLRVTFESTGPDLKISQVRAEADVEDCGGASAFAGLGCRARNVARTAAASAAAAALTGRYRGQPLRVLAEPPPFSLDLGGRTATLRLTPLRVGATGPGLVVPAKLDLE